HDYNCAGEWFVLRSQGELPLGRSALRLVFTRGANGEAHAALYVNDGEVAAGPIPRTIRTSFHSVGLSIGWNAGISVSASYTAPFAFSGVLDKVVFDLI